MNIDNAVKLINKTRLENKNKWYFLQLTINDNEVSIKGYNTWIQKFMIKNINFSSPMDISVKEFKEHIKKVLTDIE